MFGAFRQPRALAPGPSDLPDRNGLLFPEEEARPGLRVKEAPALTWASGTTAFRRLPFQMTTAPAGRQVLWVLPKAGGDRAGVGP